MPPQVQTVLGPVVPGALGVVDMHEHVRFGMPGWETDSGPLFEHDAMLAETVKRFGAFQAAGGATIVDVTGIGLGRDVAFYQEVARGANVQLVACTGFWAQRGILPRYQHWYDIDAFVELFVRELTVGIGDSGVRAGVIKVATAVRASRRWRSAPIAPLPAPRVRPAPPSSRTACPGRRSSSASCARRGWTPSAS
jgi:phosphotriesterase-related protein